MEVITELRLAKGINQNLTTGFVQDYLQLYQYNMQGVIVKVINPPTSNSATFTFSINGVVVIPDSTLVIGVSETSIIVNYSAVLYQNDILTFECTSCIDLGVGSPFFMGIF